MPNWLAVKRTWFPRVNKLYQQINEATIASYQEKLRQTRVTPGEKAVSKLMQYVSYVVQDVPESTGEIQKMRQEMFSIINQEGLPNSQSDRHKQSYRSVSSWKRHKPRRLF